MIVAAIGYLSEQNVTRSPNDNIDLYEFPRDWWYIQMRLGITLFGLMQVVASFLIVWEITASLSASYITALLIICDCAAHAYNRLVLLDPILLAFILLSVYSSIKFWKCRNRPLGLRWWAWLLTTGGWLGLTLAVKYVGVFVVLLVGLQAVYDLWEAYCDRSTSLFSVVHHFLARCLGLIVVPILLYLLPFVLHLRLLDKGATQPGMGQHSAQFRLSFPDADVARHAPPVVAYGSHVTILGNMRPTGYLSTSYDLYPPGVGAEHQLVVQEFHLDELNAWGFKRPDQPELDDFMAPAYKPEPVRHGDLVRIFNIYTERHLHTHRIPAPITKHMYQITGFGEIGEFYEGSVWRILLDEPGAEVGVTPLRAVGSLFRIINNRTGCALRPGLSKLPTWGYGAWEVVCDPKGVNPPDKDQLWQIDENVNTRMPGEDLKARYQLSTLGRIWEMHDVMFKTNRGLKIRDFEGEEGLQKLLSSQPWMWPIVYKGCPGYTGNIYSLYFIGSPQVYFLNFAILCLLPLLSVVFGVQQVRQQQRQLQDAKKQDEDAKKPSTDSKAQAAVDRKQQGVTVQEGVAYLLTGWALHYLPFWTMHRILYFHQYLPSFFFSTMITGIVLDGGISRLEQLPLPLCRHLARPFALVGITAFFAASFWINFELAYGAEGDETGDILVRRAFYFDSWQT